MSSFSIWFYHKRVSILHIKWGMGSFSSARSFLKYDYIILCMCTLWRKGVMSIFTSAIFTYSFIILYIIHVHLVNAGCDGLFLLGDELPHARVPPLFFFTDMSTKHMYIYICMYVCVCVCVIQRFICAAWHIAPHVCMTHSAIYAPHP